MRLRRKKLGWQEKLESGHRPAGPAGEAGRWFTALDSPNWRTSRALWVRSSHADHLISLEQGVDHGRDRDGLTSGSPRGHRIDGHPALGEDGDRMAAGLTVVVAVDQPAHAVVQTGGGQPIDLELDPLPQNK